MINNKWMVAIRERKGLTQRCLADKCKIDRSYIAKIENGHRPSVRVAKLIGEALDCPWTIFFDPDCEFFAQNSITEQTATSA